MSLYESIEKAIREHEERFHVTNEVTEEAVYHAIRWVMRDNPDVFWFVHQYHFDKENGIVSFRYRCSPDRSVIIQESINDVVEKDFQIKYVRTLTMLEQVAYVYKWILTYCNYNVNSVYNQNIDSVFVRRNSVCTGYAKAAQYLFKLLGIGSCLVFGRLNNDEEDGRHCWNIVNIEGHYYHLDVCLGDLILEDVLNGAGITAIQRYGNYNYNCFCVSTDEILKTRSIEDSETLPPCDRNLPVVEIERLSRIDIKERNEIIGCKLTHISSSADVFLCTRDKNVVLKKFRGNDTQKCAEEYGYMNCLKRRGKHLIHLNSVYSDVRNNILAIEQSTPIVDLFCSHYYHPTFYGVLTMIRDITLGWMECRQEGIMYRDIQVCNVYKSNDGRYKLGDFGSCAYEHSRLMERVGNPWFMSPETYICGQFDERSAVYSITAVLYFVLNGLRPPFINGNNEKEALQRKINGASLPEPTILPSFPKDLAKVVMVELFGKGCAFHPSKRIQTCQELLDIIDSLRSTLKKQMIELRFPQEEFESIATTDALAFIDTDGNVSFEEVCLNDLSDELIAAFEGNDDINVSSTPMSDDVENYCRTMGICEPTFKGAEEESSPLLNDEEYLRRKRREEIKQRLLCGGKVKIMSDGMATGGNNTESVNCPHGKLSSELTTFSPIVRKRSFWNKLFGKTYTYSSIFAPAEVTRKSYMLVQVYLHLYEGTDKVKILAQESDRNAERRDYIPLQCQLKKGDKVEVLLNIYGCTLLKSDKKNVVWQGSFTKCSFDYFIPKDIDVDELSCVAILSVNGVPVGEMRFITRIVEEPRRLTSNILAHKYSKVFISYSHMDESKVKFLHEGLELGSVPHFFDRKYLKVGDMFPQVIQDYINSADLFILCWSENASKSEYVQKERLQALERAYPQVQPEQAAKLRIYPMSIEPHAELPSDMKNYYHFGTL